MSKRNSILLPISRSSDKRILVIMLVAIAALIVDTVINNVADFITSSIVSNFGIVIFVLISLMYGVSQYFILEFVKLKLEEVRMKSRYLNLMHRVVTAVQYFLTAIIIFVVMQILLSAQYYGWMLTLVTATSYTLNVVLLGLFAQRFFSWYRSNKNTIVVLLYGLSAAALAITSVVAVISDSYNLQPKQGEITSQSKVVYPSFDPGTVQTLLHDIYHYSDLVSFSLVWISTAVLLRHYSQRLGRAKYWNLMMLPLIYYLSSLIAFFNLYTPETDTEAFYYYIYASLNSTAGGILFGFAFRSIGKSIARNSNVRNYMTISAYGFVLLFISNQATLIAAPYPPFGLITVSFMGLSAYLMFVGLYSAAISISGDIRLRQSIRKSAMEESKLLVSIGAAQMEQKIQTKVIERAKGHAEIMMQQTGVQSSLTEHEMKQYLSTVLKEIKVLQNVDEIVKKGKEILDSSTEFLACSKFAGIRLVYNNYFDIYEKVMQRYRIGDHEGIRWVTSIIDKDNADLVRRFLRLGVQIRHVKNMPPIDFAVSDKEMIATIDKMEGGEMVQSLLVSNESAYIDHFNSIFEELWKNGIDAEDRINAIEEGVDAEDIEIIQNPAEIQKIRFNLLKSASSEILIVFPTTTAFHHQEYAGALQVLKEAAGRGVKVRILTPMDDLIEKTVEKLRNDYHYYHQQHTQPQIDIRYIESHLQTKVTILVVDRRFSLVIEKKDDSKENFIEAVGIATYSNSKSTVLSYVSIFESLWKQTEMYEQLKVHDRMQKEFINIAAHELRTPIQPLVLTSESLKRIIPNEERLSIIIRNAKKLQTLANDILDITKIESNSLNLNKGPVNLNEIILNTIADCRRQIKDANTPKFVFEPTRDVLVYADRERIVQVISNLLNNSIKFTKEGTIVITAEQKGDKDVIVAIKDTGIGIDPEIMPRLFSKFVTKSFEGTGLGLFISKHIIEAHGGKIWAINNDDGKGATFAFSLPILT
jgi:signal transduction histidine kinase